MIKPVWKGKPRVDTYEVLARALEAGIARGVRRGRRAKARGGLEDAIFRAAMDELAQVLQLDGGKRC